MQGQFVMSLSKTLCQLLSKTLCHLLSTSSTQEDSPYMTEKMLSGT